MVPAKQRERAGSAAVCSMSVAGLSGLVGLGLEEAAGPEMVPSLWMMVWRRMSSMVWTFCSSSPSTCSARSTPTPRAVQRGPLHEPPVGLQPPSVRGGVVEGRYLRLQDVAQESVNDEDRLHDGARLGLQLLKVQRVGITNVGAGRFARFVRIPERPDRLPESHCRHHS